MLTELGHLLPLPSQVLASSVKTITHLNFVQLHESGLNLTFNWLELCGFDLMRCISTNTASPVLGDCSLLDI